MPLKLDLHTHCMEAICLDPRGLISDIEAAQRIVEAVNRKGLDGIAITDHHHSDFAFRIKKLVEEQLGNDVLIIPGQEYSLMSDDGWVSEHLVELYLPDGSTFRFIPHPDILYWPSNLKGIHGVEIENGGCYISQDEVKEFAQRHNLLLLSNSDAHSLVDIGCHYNELELAELSHRAKRNT